MLEVYWFLIGEGFQLISVIASPVLFGTWRSHGIVDEPIIIMLGDCRAAFTPFNPLAMTQTPREFLTR